MLVPTFSSLDILYLEDELLVALDGEDILSDLGFRQVISVSTLEDAEGAVADQSFDLAILDVNLGQGKTSLNLARHLQRRGVSTLFVTGYNGSELPEDLRHIEIVEKPISHDRLKRAIEATVINTELLDS